MNTTKIIDSLITGLFLLSVFFAPANTLSAQTKTPADYVNPFIGTSSHGDGKTIPGAKTPFGMVQVSPNTMTGGDKGSYYL